MNHSHELPKVSRTIRQSRSTRDSGRSSSGRPVIGTIESSQTAPILDPDPIRNMTIVNRISVQELLVRDSETAQFLVESFRFGNFDRRQQFAYRGLPAAYRVDSDIQPPRVQSSRVCIAASVDSSSMARSSNDLQPKRKRHRALKSGQWFARYQELVEYTKQYGSAHVPHNWEPNVPLAQWVKRQRYQNTLREEGRHSVLTDERKAALDDIGFVWNSHEDTWEERLEELRRFHKEFRHCNVPKNYARNKALAVWVKSQRRQVGW